MSKLTDTCATCRNFHEAVSNPVPASWGECRRKPKPEPVSRDYWCEQYSAKGKEVKP